MYASIMGCMCGKESLRIQDCRYTIETRLGEGGFSVIDLVSDAKSRRLSALKRIICHSEHDEAAALEEVDYMRRLKHRSIVPCVGHCVDRRSGHRSALSEILIVMPYYKKGSVFDEIETMQLRGASMSEGRVLALLKGICEALHYLHSLTPTLLAHRDIKPHNVMLEMGSGGDKDTPVLVDFGSMGPARIVISNRSQATALQDLAAEKCTMPYRAPELFNVEVGSEISESIDIWALGCTLYAMCFLESPFDRVQQKGDSIALAALAGNVKPPAAHIYSEGLISLMLRMLSVKASDRPSAMDIIFSIESLAPSVECEQTTNLPLVNETRENSASSITADVAYVNFEDKETDSMLHNIPLDNGV